MKRIECAIGKVQMRKRYIPVFLFIIIVFSVIVAFSKDGWRKVSMTI